jgi:hypothetical protein
MHPLDGTKTTAPTPPRVDQAIAQAAQRHQMDFGYMMDLARVESGFDPQAKAPTSSARGLYQFTAQTWLATLDRHGADNGLQWAADAIGRDAAGRYGVADPAARAAILALRNDPEAAASMAAEFTADNQSMLRTAMGREPEAVDLYLAHFLGVGGAAKFLRAWDQDADQPGAVLFPSAAAANRTIFYGPAGTMRSLGDIRERFRARLDQDGPAFDGPARDSITPGGNPVLSATTTRTEQANMQQEPRPLPMLAIAPMPRSLSLDFAVDSYRRFAATQAGVTGRG